MPLYGDGLQEREWLFIDDFVEAFLRILSVIHERPQTFHVASGERVPNRWVAETICRLTGAPLDLIRPVADRPGHDRRYALDASSVRELGWSPVTTLESGLAQTVEWYRPNGDRKLGQPEFRSWLRAQYDFRLRQPGGEE